MEFVIQKNIITGGTIKHAVVVHSSKDDKETPPKEGSQFIATVVRYNAIPITIDLKLDNKIGFSSAMKRIENIVGLDDELFGIVSENQRDLGTEK